MKNLFNKVVQKVNNYLDENGVRLYHFVILFGLIFIILVFESFLEKLL